MEFEEQLEKFNKERQSELEKKMVAASKLDEASMKSFANWRDYLHKYYTTILVIVGATGILQSASLPCYRFWLYLALLGVFIGYFTINIYLFLERKWIEAQEIIMGWPATQHTHKDAKTPDIRESIKLHIEDFILNKKQEIKHTTDPKMIRYLRKVIKSNRRLKLVISLVGEQFGILERVWVFGVSVSMIMTSVGIFMIFVNL